MRVLLLLPGVVLASACPCPVLGQQAITATAPVTRESAEDKETIERIRSFASSVRRHPAAANVVVTTLAGVREDQSYVLWKWWAYNFGGRPDSAQLNGLVDGLLSEFARGPEERRLVVCDLFGRPKEDTKLTVGQLREKVRPSTRKS